MHIFVGDIFSSGHIYTPLRTGRCGHPAEWRNTILKRIQEVHDKTALAVRVSDPTTPGRRSRTTSSDVDFCIKAHNICVSRVGKWGWVGVKFDRRDGGHGFQYVFQQCLALTSTGGSRCETSHPLAPHVFAKGADPLKSLKK